MYINVECDAPVRFMLQSLALLAWLGSHRLFFRRGGLYGRPRHGWVGLNGGEIRDGADDCDSESLVALSLFPLP